MEFLKRKALTVYEYSKNLMRKRQVKEQSAKELVQWLLVQPDQENHIAAQNRLAVLSYEFHQYTELFNLLVAQLEVFSYKTKQIRRTLRLLNLLCFFLKVGNLEFANDFQKNDDLFAALEKVDTHYFEKTHAKDTKQLTYNLQLIRHRATYIRRLSSTPLLLEEERTKARSLVLQQQGDETINGLKISTSFDKSPVKSRPGCSSSPIQFDEKENCGEEDTEYELGKKVAVRNRIANLKK